MRMNATAHPWQISLAWSESLARIEEHIQSRLTGLVRDFQLVLFDQELVLRGHARTYHAKQLAQHAVMEATSLLIRANEIEVQSTCRDVVKSENQRTHRPMKEHPNDGHPERAEDDG
jgi:hypothetical protein